VETYGEALHVAGNPNPKTPSEARFSLPYVVAEALSHGSVRLAAFDPARIVDPATRDLMARLELVKDPKIDADFPVRRAARVTIETRDGRRDSHLQPTRKGDPDLPLTDVELNEKFLELSVPVLGKPKADRLLERLWHLESQPRLDLH
jgi:2-methylcitrate dehydratase PrpD